MATPKNIIKSILEEELKSLRKEVILEVRRCIAKEMRVLREALMPSSSQKSSIKKSMPNGTQHKQIQQIRPLNVLEETVNSGIDQTEPVFKSGVFSDILNRTARENVSSSPMNSRSYGVGGQQTVVIPAEPVQQDSVISHNNLDAHSRRQMMEKVGMDMNFGVSGIDVPNDYQNPVNTASQVREIQIPTETPDGKPIDPRSVNSDMLKVFSRDYRSLLKATDKKARQYRGH